MDAVAKSIPSATNTRAPAQKAVQILGCRGVPNAHGGFEMFAEQLSVFLVERGWKVTVYCQGDGDGDGQGQQTVWRDTWNGVNRVHIETGGKPALGSVYFDWMSTRMAAKEGELVLTLGYNTALFLSYYRISSVPNLINMDGLEWKRDKWSMPARAWLYINERLGCWLGNKLVADHPEIGNHLATRVRNDKIRVIPYGAPKVPTADESLLEPYGVSAGNYAVVIARPEPENSIAEIVRAFCAVQRDHKLVVLGNYRPDENAFHRDVLAAANDQVLFPGAIYDADTVGALRYFARFYVHGHQVGGTNPSLVEALGAGSAVLAHDNAFNRWVAADAGCYFSDQESCQRLFDKLFAGDHAVEELKRAATRRHSDEFILTDKLAEYENLLLEWLPVDECDVESVTTPTD